MNLTVQNVREVFRDCLLKEEEKGTGNEVIARGLIHDIAFNKERLDDRSEDIRSLLSDLPKEFFWVEGGGGGGWTFLNACLSRDGSQWGEHMHMEQLVTLGIGIGVVEYGMPPEMWKIFPGGMPYFTVNLPV